MTIGRCDDVILRPGTDDVMLVLHHDWIEQMTLSTNHVAFADDDDDDDDDDERMNF